MVKKKKKRNMRINSLSTMRNSSFFKCSDTVVAESARKKTPQAIRKAASYERWFQSEKKRDSGYAGLLIQ